MHLTESYFCKSMGCVCTGAAGDAGVTETDLAEELPLCCCRMETPNSSGSLSTLDQTCMAMESTDGMVQIHRYGFSLEISKELFAWNVLFQTLKHKFPVCPHEVSFPRLNKLSMLNQQLLSLAEEQIDTDWFSCLKLKHLMLRAPFETRSYQSQSTDKL